MYCFIFVAKFVRDVLVLLKFKNEDKDVSSVQHIGQRATGSEDIYWSENLL